MAILVIFCDKMANLVPIDFKIGLYFINWPRIDQMPLLFVNIRWLNGHNSVIFNFDALFSMLVFLRDKSNGDNF